MALTRLVRVDGATNYPYTARSYEAMKLLSPSLDGDIVQLESYTEFSGIGGGLFKYVASDTTSADNFGTVCVTSDGKRLHRILNEGGEICVNDFGADNTGTLDSSLAFARAFAVAKDLPTKKHVRINGKYRITSTDTIGGADYHSVRLVGNMQGRNQGPLTAGSGSLSDCDNDTIMVDIPAGTSVPLFKFGKNAGCIGVTFSYINQNRAAAGADFIQYGATLDALSSFTCNNVRYSGAWDFLKLRGEASYISQCYGYALNVDYYLEAAGDVCNFESLHINPNVVRPAWSYIVSAAKLPNSRAFAFIQHDGVLVSNLLVFGKGTVFYNRQNGTNRLCSIDGANFLFDKCGTMLDSDVNTAVCCHLSNGVVIHDFKASDGAFLNLSNPINTQVTQYFLNNWKLSLGAADAGIPGTGDWAPYFLNFNSSAGISVVLDDVSIPSEGTVLFNNSRGSNYVRGNIFVGTRKISLDTPYTSVLKNGKLLDVNTNDNIPIGYTVSGSNVTVNRNRVTSAAATAGNGVGLVQRYIGTLPNNSTAWAYATAVGDSTGITVTCNLPDFSDPITYTGPWKPYGNGYIARVQLSSVTNRTSFDVCANAPSAAGGTLVLSSMNLAGATVFDYDPSPSTPGFYSDQAAGLRTTMTLAAGVATSLPTNIRPAGRGVYYLMAKTANTVAVWLLSKRLDGDVGTVTEILNSHGVQTLSVAWPAGTGVVPTITSSADVSVTLTLTGP